MSVFHRGPGPHSRHRDPPSPALRVAQEAPEPSVSPNQEKTGRRVGTEPLLHALQPLQDPHGATEGPPSEPQATPATWKHRAGTRTPGSPFRLPQGSTSGGGGGGAAQGCRPRSEQSPEPNSHSCRPLTRDRVLSPTLPPQHQKEVHTHTQVSLRAGPEFTASDSTWGTRPGLLVPGQGTLHLAGVRAALQGETSGLMSPG